MFWTQFALAKVSQRKWVGDSGGSTEQGVLWQGKVVERADWWADQVHEEDGTNLGNLGQILRPSVTLV